MYGWTRLLTPTDWVDGFGGRNWTVGVLASEKKKAGCGGGSATFEIYELRVFDKWPVRCVFQGLIDCKGGAAI
jgi:hypothetical protein